MPYPVPMDILFILIVGLQAVIIIFFILLFLKKNKIDPDQVRIITESIESSQDKTIGAVRDEMSQNREEMTNALGQTREEIHHTIGHFRDVQDRNMTLLSQTLEAKIEKFREAVESRLQDTRSDTRQSLLSFNDSLVVVLKNMAEIQHSRLTAFSEQLDTLTTSSQNRIDGLKEMVAEKLKAIEENNSRQLEQMRTTVDEKLQGTLEKRLGESFRQVSDRLEQVYKGLGEMQTLATGVGDLKRVLTNVKIRGTWGEVQLGAMLAEVLTPEQYAANISTHHPNERVEFAIRLPGQGQGEPDEGVWLPIDSKFPIEDYQRLIDAADRADGKSVEDASRQLENRIKSCAMDIRNKYLNPPNTTDFGILYLPVEGLFSEIIRRTGLCETLQREYRIVVAGPTTLWSILNSLQLGFRTLAIQKHSSEIWKLLAAVKTEWAKYGEVLEKVRKKINDAAQTIDQAQVRTRAIGRKLKDVEALPVHETRALLQFPQTEWEEMP